MAAAMRATLSRAGTGGEIVTRPTAHGGGGMPDLHSAASAPGMALNQGEVRSMVVTVITMIGDEVVVCDL